MAKPKKTAPPAPEPVVVRRPEITVTIRSFERDPFMILMKTRAALRTSTDLPTRQELVSGGPITGTVEEMLRYARTWVTVVEEPPGRPVAATPPPPQAANQPGNQAS